ncbi:hypothetical protein PQR71_41495 [Paraburkholderia fungorum]|uniref:hypothetical protein n=1 Tax=Paraburkholderia fungorum TaxID=134537 RepID=UPI0038B928E9
MMLSNDMAHEWQKDTELGQKIGRAMSFANDKARKDMASIGGYGAVVECEHADCQTLAMLDGYTAFKYIDSQSWIPGGDENLDALRLLKSAAKKLGYRLVKNPAA